MAESAFRLNFNISKDTNRGLLVKSVWLKNDSFKSYFSVHKQQLHLHPQWLQDHVRSIQDRFSRSTVVEICLDKHRFRQYFSTNKFKFSFKGCDLLNERDEIKKFNEAEERMQNAIKKRLETRRINKQRRLEQDSIRNHENILDGLRNLFSTRNTNQQNQRQTTNQTTNQTRSLLDTTVNTDHNMD